MKILVVTQYFWPENFQINGLVKSLQEKGAEITVLTGKPNYPNGKIFPCHEWWRLDREKYFDVEVFRVPIIPRGRAGALMLILNYLSFVFSSALIGPIMLRGKKFDRIFVYAPSPITQAIPAIYFSYLYNAKLALWVQDLWPDSLESTGFIKNKFWLDKIRYLVKYIYRKSDLILVQSKSFIQSVKNISGENVRISHLPNALDLSEDMTIDFDRLPLEYEAIGVGLSFVCAGNIGRAQAWKEAILEFKRFENQPEVKFYFVGDGSECECLDELIAAEEITNVYRLPRLPSDSMIRLFELASVLFLTLKSDQSLAQTIPGKLQSYMRAGKPILCFADGEVARIVKSADAGLVASPSSPRDLGDRIEDIITMGEDELIALGECSKAYADKNYDQEFWTERLLYLLENMAD